MRYSSWVLVILGHFLPFYPPNNWENQNFKKMTEASRDIIILNMCIKNHNHTIWNTTNIIFCHLGPFSALLPHYYLPFDLPNNPKKSKFWKTEKKAWRYYHFTLHTTNDDHMMHDSWDMQHNRHNFLSFWINFCSFTPLTTQKIKILKNWKKCV